MRLAVSAKANQASIIMDSSGQVNREKLGPNLTSRFLYKLEGYC